MERKYPGEGASSFWLLASGFWLLASGFWLLASGFWLLAAGCSLLASGFWLLASGFWLLASGFWLLAWLLAAGCWLDRTPTYGEVLRPVVGAIDSRTAIRSDEPAAISLANRIPPTSESRCCGSAQDVRDPAASGAAPDRAACTHAAWSWLTSNP